MMRSWMQGPVLFVLFSLGAAGCIVTANAGRYVPADRPERDSPPAELKVGLMEFTDRLGARTENTRRLTESFLDDLRGAGIFAQVVHDEKDVDVILAGRVLRMQQPISQRSMDNDAMGMLIPMVMSSLGVLPLLGVPTDCGEAEASIVVRALDPRFQQELSIWHGEGEARSCSGLYYRGWPLSKALSRATGKILAGMDKDAPALVKTLSALKGWHRAYNLLTADDLRSPASVPALIRALGDQDERIRVRAVAALRDLGRSAALATPALIGCLADDDHVVRRESIRALVALEACDETTLLRLAALRGKGGDRGVIHDIDRATRALKFLNRSSGLPPRLAAQVKSLGAIDRQERIAAAAGIEKSEQALPALVLALQDPEPDVRLRAVQAIEAIGAYDHKPSMYALAGRSRNDRSKTVRQAAQESVRRMELLAISEGRSVDKTAPVKKHRKTATAKNGPVVAVFLTQDALRRLKREQLSDYLAVRLTSQCGYRIIPQDQIKKHLMEEKKKTYRHCYDQRCRIELGKAVAAEKILAVRVFKTGEKCVVTANLYDLRTETTERAATTRIKCADAALMGALDDIAHQLSQAPRISGQ